MVTGDDVITGAAIAAQLGIPGSAMLGSEFAALSDEERLARIDDIGVVGRVAPEHKVLLVQTLKQKGDVVAMAGDGVNDVPAIKSADIGIAMGSGTQVARNASRMILSDDNYATIMRAVRGGRVIYDNLNKYIRFVMLELVAYIITFLGASILNIAAGQPFSASQVLYINFLVNAPLGVAIGFDQASPGLMDLKPRSRDASIMTKGLLITAGLVGLFFAVCTLALIALRQVALRQRRGRHLDGTDRVLAAPRRLRLPGPKRDGLGVHPRDVRQPAPEPHRRSRRSCSPCSSPRWTRCAVCSTPWSSRPRNGSWRWCPRSLLLFLWEIGKLTARRRMAGAGATPPVDATTA